MFEKLYRDARTAARHQAGPLVEDRMAFLADRASQGYTTNTLRWLAAQLLIVAQQLPVGQDQKLHLEDIEEIADRWALRSDGHSRDTANRIRESFRSTATAWFRYLNRLEEPPAAPVPFLPLIEYFATYMEKERGLEASTIERTCQHVKDFLGWFAHRHDVLGVCRQPGCGDCRTADLPTGRSVPVPPLGTGTGIDCDHGREPPE